MTLIQVYYIISIAICMLLLEIYQTLFTKLRRNNYTILPLGYLVIVLSFAYCLSYALFRGCGCPIVIFLPIIILLIEIGTILSANYSKSTFLYSFFYKGKKTSRFVAYGNVFLLLSFLIFFCTLFDPSFSSCVPSIFGLPKRALRELLRWKASAKRVNNDLIRDEFLRQAQTGVIGTASGVAVVEVIKYGGIAAGHVAHYTHIGAVYVAQKAGQTTGPLCGHLLAKDLTFTNQASSLEPEGISEALRYYFVLYQNFLHEHNVPESLKLPLGMRFHTLKAKEPFVGKDRAIFVKKNS